MGGLIAQIGREVPFTVGIAAFGVEAHFLQSQSALGEPKMPSHFLDQDDFKTGFRIMFLADY